MAEQVEVQLNVGVNTTAVDTFAAKLKDIAAQSLNIPLNFTSNAEGLVKSLGGAADKLTEINSSAKGVSGTLTEQQGLYKKIISDLNASNAALRDQRNTTVKNSDVWKQINEQIVKNKGLIKDAQNAISRLQGTLDRSKLAVDKITESFRAMAREAGKPVEGGFFDGLLGKLTLGGIAVEAFSQAIRGIGNVVAQGVAFEQLTLGLEAFTGSAENAKLAYQAFKDTAIRTPFGIEGVAQAGKTLLAFGVNLETTIDATDRLAIVAGATGSDLNNLARNLGQISAQGRAYTRDLNQFATAGIPIYQELSNVLGISVIEVRKFAEEGKIGFDEVQAALVNLTAAGSAFSDLAARQLQTVGGAAANLKTEVTELSGEFIKTFGPTIVAGLGGLTNTLVVVKDNFQSVAIVVGTFAGAALLGKLKPALAALIPLWGQNIAALAANRAVIQAAIAQQLALAASTNSTTAAMIALNNVTALNTQLAAANSAAQVASLGKAAVAALKYGAVLAAVAATFILLKTSADAYQPVEALKQDIEAAKRFSGELDKLSESLGTTSNVTPAVSSAFESLAAATNNVGGNFYQYNLQLRNAEANTIAYAEATDAQGAASLKLVQITQGYIDSTKKSASATREALGAVQARKTALQADTAAIEGQIAALQALKPKNKEEADLIRLNISLLKTRLGANNSFVAALQKQEQQLLKLTSVQGLYNTLLSNPTVENRTAAFEAQNKALEGLFKSLNAVIGAQRTLAEAPVKDLERQLAAATSQLDLQLAKLKEQKSDYDKIVTAIETRISLESREAVGTEGRRQLLELDRQILALRIEQNAKAIQTVQYGTLEFREAQRVLLADQQRLKALDVQLKSFNALDQAQTDSLRTSSAIADTEFDRAGTAADLKNALLEQQAVLATTLRQLDGQKAALDNLQASAALAGSKIDENINGSLQEGISKAGELVNKLKEIGNVQVQVSFNQSQNRASGGPVFGGSAYTVNELGREAFLSASGRLSMINAPSWGTWKAPESGTVIPAHLTKKLNIPSGGINLNNAPGGSLARKVSRGGFNGDPALVQSLHRISAVQNNQAAELGRLSRVLDRIEQREWKVDVNIAGNNPLLNKLRQRH